MTKPKTRPSQPNGRSKKPWEPSARQLQIFDDAHRGDMTRADIAKKYKISKTRVNQLVKKITDWLKPQMMDSIRDVKVQHTQSLMHLFHEAMAAWERSKLPGVRTETGETATVTTSTKTVTTYQVGDPRYLAEARAALAQIRDIWGANAAVEDEVEADSFRVAGMSREEAIAKRISQMQLARKQLLN